MFRFLLFLIFIILIQRLLKTLQEQKKQQQEEAGKDKFEDIFQTLGFPFPQEVTPEPEPEKPKQPSVVKMEIKKPEIKIPELKSVKIEAPRKEITEEVKEELLALSEDKLEEGIVLSEILGLPKAYQIRRGGGIGIRAGLKNR
jgi:hypothetical protein